MTTFFERLEARSRERETLLCIGLDPAFERHSATEVAAYLLDIVAATHEFTACYKPNLAFYEQYGIEGWRQLERLLAGIPPGVPVIADGKRGDMGNTATAYARALFDAWNFDAATVNPYQGHDAVAPFLAYADRGIFLLARTSNPGSADLQDLQLAEGGPLYERVVRTVTTWGPNVGLVVGATAPAEMERIRSLAPRAPILVPGVGAQGGDAAAAVRASGGEPGRVVISASRSILYAAGEGEDPIEAAARAARELRDQLNAARLATR